MRPHGRYLPWAMAMLLLMALLVRLWPLYRFAIWGSDTGEYLNLLDHLLQNGRLREGTHYLGFGFAYPYFQGLELWAGSLALLGGLPFEQALYLTGPVTAALAAPLTVLAALHLLAGHRPIALLAGGVVAVALPHVFATSHPMPGSTGEILALTALLVHLRALERPAWHLPLLPLVLALLLTHHFSLYFYVLGSFGAWVLYTLSLPTRERWAPTGRGVLWYSCLTLLTSYYWLVVAEPFGTKVLGQLPVPPVVWVIAPMAGLALTAVAMLRWPGVLRLQPRLDGLRRSLLKPGGFVLLIVSVMVLATTRGLPGTGIILPPVVLVIVLPLVLLLTLSTFPRQIPFYPKGHLLLGWLSLPLLSLVVAIVSASHELISYRHMSYLMEPLALCVGVGARWLFELMEGHALLRTRLRPFTITVFSILILSAGLLAYPPPEMFGGFQEGTNASELDLVHWSRGISPPQQVPAPDEHSPRVVTDHRLSSFLFGQAHLSPTWDLAGSVLHRETRLTSPDQLLVRTPGAGPGQAGYVVLTREVMDHAALAQWEVASGLSPAAQAKFQTLPFWRTFDNGEGQVYMVDWTLP